MAGFFRFTLLVAIVLALIGCTLPPKNGVDNFNSPDFRFGRYTKDPYSLIANDLIGALLQAADLQKRQLRIKIPSSSSEFELALEKALVNFGIPFERFGTRNVPNALIGGIYKDSLSPLKITAVIVFNKIGLKRQYQLDDGYVEPLSSLYVHGADPSKVTLSDDNFLEREPRL